MTDRDDPMDAVEHRLDVMSGDLHVLKDDVRVLKDDVRVLKDDARVLKDDVRVLKDDVRVLKADVGVLKADVGVLKADVGVLKADVGTLRDGVNGLRVLYEHHDERIRTILEVQAYQGRQLEEHGELLRGIKEQLEPLADLRNFVRRIADNHEHRLTALEKHTGIQ